MVSAPPTIITSCGPRSCLFPFERGVRPCRPACTRGGVFVTGCSAARRPRLQVRDLVLQDPGTRRPAPPRQPAPGPERCRAARSHSIAGCSSVGRWS